LDTADAWAVNDSNFDVSLQTPSDTPWVSCNVVLALFGVNTITYDGNTMVNSGTTLRGVEYTLRVELKYRAISFNASWDGAGSNGNLELICIILDDRSVTGRPCLCELGRVEVASLNNSFIGVVSLSLQALVFCIQEGQLMRPTLATCITIDARAIEKLLLREGIKSATLDLPSAFQNCSSWKGPAWSTRAALILNGINSDLSSPVDGRRNAKVGVNKACGVIWLSLHGREDSIELIRGPVSKLINPKGECVIFIKVLLNNASVVLLEDVGSHSKLLLSAVLLPKLGNKSDELHFSAGDISIETAGLSSLGDGVESNAGGNTNDCESGESFSHIAIKGLYLLL
jgi:hypothetical protein